MYLKSKMIFDALQSLDDQQLDDISRRNLGKVSRPTIISESNIPIDLCDGNIKFKRRKNKLKN